MQIDIHGRAVKITEELRDSVEKRFTKISKQVADATTLRVDLREADGSHGPAEFIAEVALHVKGTTLRASDRSRDLAHAIHLAADELAVQVKRHQEKRRDHRGAGKSSGETATA